MENDSTVEIKPIQKTTHLSFFEKVAYGLGGGGEALIANLLFILAYPIYQAGLGIDARWIGWAVGIPRLWDALVDPFIGSLSDNSKNRFGRRRPFIFVGAVVTGLACMFMWMPPLHWGKGGIFVHFFILSILYYTCYGLFFIPYCGLGYELSRDYDERVSVMSFKVFFMYIVGTLLLPLALPMCFWFGKNKIEGVRIVGIIFGIFIIVFGIMPALFCKERIHNQQTSSLVHSLKYSFSNKPFMILCGILMFTIVSLYIAQPLQYYINMCYIVPGDETRTSKFIMYNSIIMGVMCFLCVPVVNYFSRRYGKKIALQGGLLLVMLGMLSNWFCFTPKNPYLQFINPILTSPGITCLWVILGACIADICDFDELATGCRREGMFGAVYGLFLKGGVGLTMVASGYIIGWTGYKSDHLLQSADTILKTRVMVAFAPLIFLIFAVFLTSIYPLSKQDVLRTRNLLDARQKGRTVSSI